MLSVVFMGTPEFAVPSLEALTRSRHRVVAVVTGPDKPRGRGKRIAPSPVKNCALAAGLDVLQPESLRDENFLEKLRDARADIFVVVAFRILPAEVLAIPPLGAVNLHASLLPRYRGAAPIHRALMNGETETGVTTFLLREHIDAGGIFLQEAVGVGEDMTAGELHDMLAERGASLLLTTLDGIEHGKLKPREQDESLATSAPKLFREDCRIDWSSSGKRVHDHVRGLSPRPGAWTLWSNRIVKILRTRRVPMTFSSPTALPGVVLSVGEYILVACGDGPIEILELTLEGRKPMTAGEFLRGYRLQPGDSFT
ncbi:MAG: methionyl-tRNA formyltransferase [Bacteroidota bacterium]|nr:methionyl-tRNA formyltransferase [Bacteroidota bacterium]